MQYLIPNDLKYSTASLSLQHKHWIFVSITSHLPYLYNSQKELLRCALQKGVLKHLQNSQVNTCARVFIKNRLWHTLSSVNFVKFLRILALLNTSSSYFSINIALIFLDFSYMLEVSGYLAKQTLFTSKFSGLY